MKNNNSFSIIALGLSGVSLLVSVYIVCSENRFNADWYAIVVGILALLVTVLIGWNIYTVIDFDRRVDKKINGVEALLRNHVNSYVYNTSYQLTVNNFGFIGEVMYATKQYNLSAIYYARALNYAEKLNNDQRDKIVLFNGLEVAIANCNKLVQGDQDEIIENIRMVNDIRIVQLIHKIKSLG
ncbi:exported hypothetical protein [uncultured Dysgonomonas sp.]|uniref:Uncharacterized protein n=1 Tax=uncultured Dysgonomonas sp. TaxID=206096 RepID=A0A212K3W2_9BACT|nr:hypothetical protein [uncultured Dysgonomonas sp.]SBW06399.1 exported hypothetical protein [uncultured Dysgonomonas sp.]